MRAVDIIMKKRDGKTLSHEELAFLVNGYVTGDIPDYQVSAWAMAVFFSGMTSRETADLTGLMLDSGERITLAPYGLPYVDKHSTGGVGDKTSLVIAPIVASLGIRVPMMSGRALGHTGGTLDKLESIPGYRTDLSIEEFKTAIDREGMAMTGQSKEVVPADRLLYALRDVTATVESIPLITASILSKKVAEGADALVFDVKFGSGAFMKKYDDAAALARSLVDTGKAMGKRITALLTDMDEPLGRSMGNFLEVEECIDCLEGGGPEDLVELNRELAASMIVLAGTAGDLDEARELANRAIASGAALKCFMDNVKRQGGAPEELLSRRGSWRSEYQRDICASEAGIVQRVDALACGRAGVFLGVGRNRTEDRVSPLAGIEFLAPRGQRVEKGQALLRLWGKDAVGLEAAVSCLEGAVDIEPAEPAARKIVVTRIESV